VFLRHTPSWFTVGGMTSTLIKPRAKKPARPGRKVTNAMKATTPRTRLTPRPGPSAAEFFANLPPPAKDFDAEAVAGGVALRAHR
jgi:hypothetical protein